MSLSLGTSISAPSNRIPAVKTPLPAIHQRPPSNAQPGKELPPEQMPFSMRTPMANTPRGRVSDTANAQPAKQLSPEEMPFSLRGADGKYPARAGSDAAAKEDTDNVAVAFGRRTMDAVRAVSFTRANPMRPDVVIDIRYDSPRALRAADVGCQIPPGWNGGGR